MDDCETSNVVGFKQTDRVKPALGLLQFTLVLFIFTGVSVGLGGECASYDSDLLRHRSAKSLLALSDSLDLHLPCTARGRVLGADLQLVPWYTIANCMKTNKTRKLH